MLKFLILVFSIHQCIQLTTATPLYVASHDEVLHVLGARSPAAAAAKAPATAAKAPAPAAGKCDLKAAKLTTSSSSSLPPPSGKLAVVHVAIGRGTQNYVCAKETDVPAPIGATATLFDASCIAATDPKTFATLVGGAIKSKAPANLATSGRHFFPDPTKPVFDLSSAPGNPGTVSPKKVASAPPPANAIKGQDNKGDGAVLWLKLAEGATKEVYRVNTAGGNPPKSCKGMPAKIAVDYAAEYWFFAAAK